MMKNQEGFVPLVVIVGAVVAATIFGGSVFLSNQPILQKSSHYVHIVTEQDFEDINDPILQKHFAAWANQKQYQVKTTANQKKVYTVFDIEKNDNIDFRYIENDGKSTISETVSLGDTVYVKDYTDNIWWKQKINTADIQTNTIKDTFVKNATYKNLRIDTCRNLTCYVYEEINQTDPESKRIFWFDNKQFLLRREELIFGEFKNTNEYSYTHFQLLPPLPTKEVPDKKSIYEFSEGKSFRPTKEDVKKVEQELQVSLKNSSTEDSQVLDLTSEY